MIKDILRYRFFILSSIRNEFTNQFVRSELGGLWGVLNPLFQVLIYTLILSNVLSSKLPGVDNKYAYAIYLMSGLLGWNLFNLILTKGLNVFVQNANLLKKLSFPKITLPIIIVGAELINSLFLFLAMIVIFTVLGHGLTWSMLWFFPLSLFFALFAISMGVILGVINVFVRDLSHILTIVLQVWFWFTPILYPVAIVPPQYVYLFNFNPIYPFIQAYHNVIYDGRAPDFTSLLGCVLLTGLMAVAGVAIFRKTSEAMVDEL